jgi:hypothetical protein
MKSELRTEPTVVESTLAEAAQRSTPRIKNVMKTETKGETFKGRIAHTVIKRKSHGRERKRSVKALAIFQPDSVEIAGKSSDKHFQCRRN